MEVPPGGAPAPRLTQRTCLSCDRPFDSTGPGNRACPRRSPRHRKPGRIEQRGGRRAAVPEPST
jgi:hypothetical protein